MWLLLSAASCCWLSFTSFLLLLLWHLTSFYYFTSRLLIGRHLSVSDLHRSLRSSGNSLATFSSSIPVTHLILSPHPRSPTSSRCASAAATVWTPTPRCGSSACGATAARASRSSCPSYTAASAPAAKVGSPERDPRRFASLMSALGGGHFNICKDVCWSPVFVQAAQSNRAEVSRSLWRGELAE